MIHTTNYQNTFIEIADDCPVDHAEIPPVRLAEKTAATLQFEMVMDHPYRYTSDDVMFAVYAAKNKINKSAQTTERQKFFSKGQPCFRSSPLTKRYGWGVHHDAEGKVALYAIESEEYKKFAADQSLAHVKAMRSSRK